MLTKEDLVLVKILIGYDAQSLVDDIPSEKMFSCSCEERATLDWYERVCGP